MSMDRPNEYEQAIEAYAEAVRDENEAVIAAKQAMQEEVKARETRQALWRVVKTHIADGHTKPGIYRLNNQRSGYSDGLLIQPHHDYPDLFPMFR